MGFVPFENVIRIEPIFESDFQKCENVLHYLVDETPDEDTAISLAAAYCDWFTTHDTVIFPSSVILTAVKWTIMETQNAPGGEYTTDLPVAGGLVQNALPNNVSVAIRLLTQYRGRSYRGRIFHVGLTNTMVDLNRLTPAMVTNFTTSYSDLITLPTDVGPAVLAVASRVSGGVERAQGVATPVIDIQVDSTVDSQRRRLPGRGS